MNSGSQTHSEFLPLRCLSVYEEVTAIAVVEAREGAQGIGQVPNSTQTFQHLWPNLKVTSYFKSLKIFFKLFPTLSTVRGGCAWASVIPEKVAVLWGAKWI